jgi:hypothetical protein
VAVHYNVRDSGDALSVDVRRDIALWERFAFAGFAAALPWFIPNGFLPSTILVVLSTLVAVAVFALFRTVSARLSVTNLDLQIAGARRRGLSSSTKARTTIPTAKIHRLEYQEHESGGQGIYAVLAFGEPQVLPYVDGAQADEIMAAIKTKFPGLAEMWKRSEDAAAKGRG